MDFAGAYSAENLQFLLEGLYFTLLVAVASIALSFLFGCIVGVIRYMRLPVLSPVLLVAVEPDPQFAAAVDHLFYAVRPAGDRHQAGAGKRHDHGADDLRSGDDRRDRARGLASIDKGQIEAARSSGLSSLQTLWHIVLPQGLRRMVPPLVSQFISLLKDTSLAVVISLPELMHNAGIVIGHGYAYTIPILLLVALIYFTVNFLLSLVSRRLEARHA